MSIASVETAARDAITKGYNEIPITIHGQKWGKRRHAHLFGHGSPRGLIVSDANLQPGVVAVFNAREVLDWIEGRRKEVMK